MLDVCQRDLGDYTVGAASCLSAAIGGYYDCTAKGFEYFQSYPDDFLQKYSDLLCDVEVIPKPTVKVVSDIITPSWTSSYCMNYTVSASVGKIDVSSCYSHDTRSFFNAVHRSGITQTLTLNDTVRAINTNTTCIQGSDHGSTFYDDPFSAWLLSQGFAADSLSLAGM